MTLEPILTFILKVFALAWFRKQLNKKQMSRVFDVLDPEIKAGILGEAVSLAKREITDNSMPPNTAVVPLAVEWVWHFEIVANDFSLINLGDYPSFVGPMPIKVPRP